MIYWTLLICLLGNIISPAISLSSQSSIDVTDAKVEYLYGESATFSARINNPTPLTAAYLMISQPGAATRSEPITPTENGEISLTISLIENPFRPFSQIEYWYHFTLSSGEDIDSQKFSFAYEDNLMTWQELSNGNVVIKWVEGDFDFGRQAMDVANSGLQQVQKILPLPSPPNLKIYIYPTNQELQRALQPYVENWVAGQANPELGVILVAIPVGPDQLLEMNRLIPHEEMHILLYAAIGERLTLLPAWLTEGLASLAETYPNSDYQRAISKAVASNTLISFNELCQGIPREASRTLLAYAQSSSFTNYLYSTYGTSGLQALLQAYQDGLSCTEGAQKAMSVPLTELEYNWRQSILGNGAEKLVWQNFSPYLILLLAILIIPLLASVGFLSKKRLQKSPPQDNR